MKPPITMTSNAAEVAKRVAAWSGNVNPALATACLQSATVLTAAAKRESPVKTGRLRRSISYQAGGQLRYVVSPAVPYAAAVHGGSGIYGKHKRMIEPGTLMRWKSPKYGWRSAWKTKGQKPNPFMSSALKNSEPRIRQIAARAGATIVTRQG